MPSLNDPRSYPPSWAAELREAILSPDSRRAAPEWVSILPATREMEGWIIDSRPYEIIHRYAWLSAIADFRASASQLGPGLRHALGGDLTAADGAAASLKADIEGPGGAPAIAARLQARHSVDQQAFGRLSARWATLAIREASWKLRAGSRRSRPSGRS